MSERERDRLDWPQSLPGISGKVVLIASGHRGIGRAITLAMISGGAKVANIFPEGRDHEVQAEETHNAVRALGGEALFVQGDIGLESVCVDAVARTASTFGTINVVINNAAARGEPGDLADITAERFDRTLRTTVHGTFFLSRAALQHLKRGDSVINSTSTAAYFGDPNLVDYSAAKGAVISLTRAMALAWGGRGIRVNAVAHGIRRDFSSTQYLAALNNEWTADQVAASYMFLASDLAKSISGHVLQPTGGVIVNG